MADERWFPRARDNFAQGGGSALANIFGTYGTQASPTYMAQPDGTWGPSRAVNAAVGDSALAVLSGLSGLAAGAGGAVGDLGELFGMSHGSANRLGNDLSAAATELPWVEAVGPAATRAAMRSGPEPMVKPIFRPPPTPSAYSPALTEAGVKLDPSTFEGAAANMTSAPPPPPPPPDIITKWTTPDSPDFTGDGHAAFWDDNQVQPPRPQGPVPKMYHPDQLDLDVGPEVPPPSNWQTPEVATIAKMMDHDYAGFVTPEMFEAARRKNPDELNQMLAENHPMGLMGVNNDTLGMNDRVYHFTDARGEAPRPGSAPFGYFDPDRGGFNQTFDSLGPHVGTHAAADTRRSAKGANMDWYFNPDETGIDSDMPDNFNDYEWDTHPDGKSDMVGIPGRGQMLELAANLSYPFTPEAAQKLAARLGWGGADDPMGMLPSAITHPLSPNDWTETGINRVLDNLGARLGPKLGRDGRIAAVRQFLAEEGFSNVPYVNQIEDPGSISHVMLTDRPKGSTAVLRDRRAAFNPFLSHLPNLTAGVAGAVTLADLLAGDDDT